MIDLQGPAVQAVVGQIVGVTQQSISSLQGEGKLPTGLCLGDTVQAYCHRLREQAAGRLGSELGGLDLAQERAALAREMRLGHELKNAVTRGTYAPIELLSEILAGASQAVVERFDQVPGMLAKACPDLPDSAREQIMTVLAAARNEWLRATEKLMAQRAADLDDDEDDCTDGVEESALHP